MKKDQKSAYFVASFRGKEKYGEHFERIAQIVEKNDYAIHDDINHITDEEARARSQQEIEQYWKKTAAKNISNSDIFIAEISETSISLGIEIGMAVSDYKPVLLLKHASLREKPLPVPIVALGGKIDVIHYTNESLETELNSWLEKIEGGFITKYMNVGFTKDQVDFIEYLQRKEKIKSFALTVRMILNGDIDVNTKLEEFYRD